MQVNLRGVYNRCSRYGLMGLFLLGIQAFTGMYAQNKPNFGKEPKLKSKGPTAAMYKDPDVKGSTHDWKANRLEYMVGAGASGFLGDLGGQDEPGKVFLYDFEPTTVRYSAMLGARYFVREYHSIRGGLSYAQVTGNDELTNYPNRRYRNLHFKSDIIEASGMYEFHLLKANYIHLAGAPSTRVFNGNRLGVYLCAGAGLFYSNPKANFQGEWHALRPLRTEGQGLPDGPDPYGRINLCFPTGGGISYLLNHNYIIALDFGYRWTNTDYIDDASTYYYDNDAIRERDGKLAALLANPSVLISDVPNPDWYTENQPRGGQEANDNYMYLQITISHSFTPSISNRPVKAKKKKAKHSYDTPKGKIETRGGKAPVYKEPGKKDAPKKKKGKSYKSPKKSIKKEGKKAKAYDSSNVKVKKKRSKKPSLKFGKKRKRNKIQTF
jgi:hypothetical protein